MEVRFRNPGPHGGAADAKIIVTKAAGESGAEPPAAMEAYHSDFQRGLTGRSWPWLCCQFATRCEVPLRPPSGNYVGKKGM